MHEKWYHEYGMRTRATAIVRRDGLLLLVQDRGFRQYSLPGGGLQGRETPEEAVVRELEEETGLNAVSVSPLPYCQTSDMYNTYLVFDVETTGSVRIDSVELSASRWWDGRESLPLFGYVNRVLSQLHWPK